MIKNVMIGLLLCVLGLPKLQAQDSVKVATNPSFKIVELGVRFMPTFSSFDMKTSAGGTVTSEVTLGFGFGAVLAINFTEHIGIQGELIYNALSQKFKDQSLQREINVRYINVPVLLSLNTGKSKPINLNLVAGPQFGMSLGSSTKSSGGGATDTLTTVFAANNTDVGLAYGLGLGIMLNQTHSIRFDVGYRGILGFMNISNTSNGTTGTAFILDKATVRTNAAYVGLSLLF